jgi:hypothetical protein
VARQGLGNAAADARRAPRDQANLSSEQALSEDAHIAADSIGGRINSIINTEINHRATVFDRALT